MKYSIIGFVMGSWLFSSICQAETLENPPMLLKSLGGGVGGFSWREDPHVEGGYEDNEVFRLKGNGTGVYWCWDRGPAAFVENPPLSGNFTFTARIKSAQFPEGTVGQIGIVLKGRTAVRHPVLSLRWDTYWGDNRGSGLTWFNRITPVEDMQLDCAYCEKLCHGSGQGCLGKGYENQIQGFPIMEDLWLRVKRVVDGQVSKYYLFAKYGSDPEWTQIESVTSTHNPCGESQTPLSQPLQLPHFLMPTDDHGRVSVGLFVANSGYAETMSTAEFDNITLEANNIGETYPLPLPNTFGPDVQWWPDYMGMLNNFAAKDGDFEMVDFLHDSHQIWKSEAKLARAKSGSGSGAASSGGASPVVAEGKVFQYYQDPEQHVNGMAPDIVLAVDATDGKTAWKKQLDMTTHDASGKNFTYGRTVGVRDGRVFVTGGGGRLYCLNAETGELIWKNSSRGVSNASGVEIIGGMMVLGLAGGRADASADLVAHRIDDGSEAWFFPNGSAGNGTPSRWVYEGKEYVIAANAVTKVVHLIEPETGNVLWSEDVGVNEFTVGVTSEYMFVNMGHRNRFKFDVANGPPRVGCFRITPEKAELVWQSPIQYGYAYTPVVYKDRVYITGKDLGVDGKDLIVSLDLNTGEVIDSVTIKGGVITAKSVINDRLIVQGYGGHDINDFYYIDISTDDMKLIVPYNWLPPHVPTTSYQQHMDKPVVDGRMFFRGNRHLVAYDLRKIPGSTSAFQQMKNPVSFKKAEFRIEKLQNKVYLTFTGAIRENKSVTVEIFDYMGRHRLSKILSKPNVGPKILVSGAAGSLPERGIVLVRKPDQKPVSSLFNFID